jgi:hypothetical protein
MGNLCGMSLLTSSFRFAMWPKPVTLFQIWMMLSNAFLVENHARAERYPGTIVLCKIKVAHAQFVWCRKALHMVK